MHSSRYNRFSLDLLEITASVSDSVGGNQQCYYRLLRFKPIGTSGLAVSSIAAPNHLTTSLRYTVASLYLTDTLACLNSFEGSVALVVYGLAAEDTAALRRLVKSLKHTLVLLDLTEIAASSNSTVRDE